MRSQVNMASAGPGAGPELKVEQEPGAGSGPVPSAGPGPGVALAPTPVEQEPIQPASPFDVIFNRLAGENLAIDCDYLIARRGLLELDQTIPQAITARQALLHSQIELLTAEEKKQDNSSLLDTQIDAQAAQVNNARLIAENAKKECADFFAEDPVDMLERNQARYVRHRVRPGEKPEKKFNKKELQAIYAKAPHLRTPEETETISDFEKKVSQVKQILQDDVKTKEARLASVEQELLGLQKRKQETVSQSMPIPEQIQAIREEMHSAMLELKAAEEALFQREAHAAAAPVEVKEDKRPGELKKAQEAALAKYNRAEETYIILHFKFIKQLVPQSVMWQVQFLARMTLLFNLHLFQEDYTPPWEALKVQGLQSLGKNISNLVWGYVGWGVEEVQNFKEMSPNDKILLSNTLTALKNNTADFVARTRERDLRSKPDMVAKRKKLEATIRLKEKAKPFLSKQYDYLSSRGLLNRALTVMYQLKNAGYLVVLQHPDDAKKILANGFQDYRIGKLIRGNMRLYPAFEMSSTDIQESEILRTSGVIGVWSGGMGCPVVLVRAGNSFIYAMAILCTKEEWNVIVDELSPRIISSTKATIEFKDTGGATVERSSRNKALIIETNNTRLPRPSGPRMLSRDEIMVFDMDQKHSWFDCGTWICDPNKLRTDPDYQGQIVMYELARRVAKVDKGGIWHSGDKVHDKKRHSDVPDTNYRNQRQYCIQVPFESKETIMTFAFVSSFGEKMKIDKHREAHVYLLRPNEKDRAELIQAMDEEIKTTNQHAFRQETTNIVDRLIEAGEEIGCIPDIKPYAEAEAYGIFMNAVVHEEGYAYYYDFGHPLNKEIQAKVEKLNDFRELLVKNIIPLLQSEFYRARRKELRDNANNGITDAKANEPCISGDELARVHNNLIAAATSFIEDHRNPAFQEDLSECYRLLDGVVPLYPNLVDIAANPSLAEDSIPSVGVPGGPRIPVSNDFSLDLEDVSATADAKADPSPVAASAGAGAGPGPVAVSVAGAGADAVFAAAAPEEKPLQTEAGRWLIAFGKKDLDALHPASQTLLVAIAKEKFKDLNKASGKDKLIEIALENTLHQLSQLKLINDGQKPAQIQGFQIVVRYCTARLGALGVALRSKNETQAFQRIEKIIADLKAEYPELAKDPAEPNPNRMSFSHSQVNAAGAGAGVIRRKKR